MAWLQRLMARRPPVDEHRWVVLDVASSGLDAARDRLLAIAAVGVRIDGGRACIALADSFEVVLRQPDDLASHDKANILLHHIGVAAQRGGVESGAAVDAFERFIGHSPLLGFHVSFDRVMIERVFAAQEHAPPVNPWLDLEPLAAVLVPQVNGRALDDWLTHFGIRCLQRHNAMADALATAELLLRLWPLLRREGATGIEAASRLARQRRWMSGV
jgi:DNA polymerase-3 subunit epsilon